MGLKYQRSYTCDRCDALYITNDETSPPHWRHIGINRAGSILEQKYWYCQHCALMLEDFHKGHYRPVDDSVNKLTPSQLMTRE